MTNIKKQELILQVVTLLNNMIDIDIENDAIDDTADEKPIELLTIKECAAAISGLTESTVRQLAVQNKVPYIRTGKGKNGKILINKQALLEYLSNNV